MSGKVYGPSVRWFNPLQVRVFRKGDLWAASYRRFDGSSTVEGCSSRQEALDELRHFVTMRIAEIDGKWTEVDTDGNPIAAQPDPGGAAEDGER